MNADFGASVSTGNGGSGRLLGVRPSLKIGQSPVLPFILDGQCVEIVVDPDLRAVYLGTGLKAHLNLGQRSQIGRRSSEEESDALGLRFIGHPLCTLGLIGSVNSMGEDHIAGR